jgi:hypothetical protein
MLDEISRQIEEAHYVGWGIWYSGGFTATVLRYIHNDKIQERCVGFTYIIANKSSYGLSNMQNVVSKSDFES